jgi:DUF917 family protein
MSEGGIVESILAAESEEKARQLTWMGGKAKVALIGTAASNIKQGVIMSRYRRLNEVRSNVEA